MKQFKLLPLLLLMPLSQSLAAEIRVAVAANFYKPMQQLAAQFEKQTGHSVMLSAGSTGSLFAQIQHGAPFELFLSADQKRPTALVTDGTALKESQFTYAKGQLALWSEQVGRIDSKGKLKFAEQERIAIANPKTAPYGAAAIEVLKHYKLYPKLKGQLVEGKNLSQTFQHISTGAAQQGFVALSQISYQGKIKSGSAWIVPTSLHHPLNQDAVILKNGANNPAVTELKAYLQSDAAKALIRTYGYQI